MEKLPPVEKVYEAWTALVDDRYDLSPEALIVRSSDGSKEHRVTWDDEGRYRSDSVEGAQRCPQARLRCRVGRGLRARGPRHASSVASRGSRR